MKGKLFVLVLTSVLLFSVIEVAFADVCPTCHGAGKTTVQKPCPICNGGGASSPDIVRKSINSGDASTSARKAVNVQGVFHNNGNEGVTATVTGTVKTSSTQTFTNTTTAYFEPNADTTVTVRIEGVDRQPYYAYFIEIAGYGSTNCQYCQGTGYAYESITCPSCTGSGVVSGLAGGISADYVGPVAGVAIVGAVAVGGFFFMKKRRVTEQSLRRMASFEFQSWAMKRLQANPASQKDSYLGIDAYTADGYPVQIRQEDDVGRRAIDSFAAALARSKARYGTIVAFGFGKDSFEGLMKARLNYRLEIKTLTVRELLVGRERSQ
jgi:hypothetical protein